MANKKPVNKRPANSNSKTVPNSRSKTNSKSKKNDNNTKKIIAILTIILVLLLIIAIVFISVKGLWGDIIDIIKGLLGGDDENNTSNKPIPSGVAQLSGDIMEMRVLDIGQGDCILLLFPDGQVMVMDIGSELGTTSPWNVIDGALKELSITTIDYLFLSHTDYDHIRETKKLIQNYEIKSFYLPRADIDTSATWNGAYTAALAETYVENGITKNAEINENIGAYDISGDNWIMRCYSFDEADYPSIKKSSSATNKNAVSPICLLEYAGRTIVLTGDSNEKNEPYLINKGYFDNVDADVLKVAHHGSKTSTVENFLNKVDCEYAIISCGAENEYGHPTPELLGRLDAYIDLVPDDDYNGFAQVYRTDEDGTITVQIDENGVMNLIADENAGKNTTTGTPVSELQSGEIVESGQVAMIYLKEDIDYEMLFAA